MDNRLKLGGIIILQLCLAACTNTGAIKVGPDTYTVSTRVPFGGPASAKGEALTEANKFCASMSQEMLLNRVPV